MKRRTLDVMFSIGGLGLAGLLAILGLVLASNADFAKNYVRDQLSRQKITFTEIDKLAPEEKEFTRARTGCVIRYAGQALTTGKQAECYANEYIGGHLRDPKKIPGANGLTYAELGNVQGELRAKIAAAKAGNGPGLSNIERQLAEVTAAREIVFKGEMLRGALLSSYGFSVLGEKAEQGAKVAFVAAWVLALLSIAGFIHAFVTPKTKAFALPEKVRIGEEQLVRD